MGNLTATSFASLKYNFSEHFANISASEPFQFFQSALDVIGHAYDGSAYIVPKAFKDWVYKLGGYDVNITCSIGSCVYLLSGAGELHNYTLTKINDETVSTAIKQFAINDVRTVRTYYARHNQAIMHFFSRPVSLYPLPSPETVTVTVKSPDNAESEQQLSWVACDTPTDFTIPKSQSSSYNSVLLFDRNVEAATYRFSQLHSLVGVLRIHSFEPASDTTGDLFASSLVTAVKLLTSTSALIIDLRSTTGNNYHLVNSFFRLLWPSVFPISGKQDFLKSELGSKFAQYLVSSESGYTAMSYDGRYDLSRTLYTPSVTRTVISDSQEITETWTQSFALKTTHLCDKYQKDWNYAGLAPFEPHRLIILTDGLASPAVATFIHHVNESKLAWVIMYAHTSVFTSSDDVATEMLNNIAPSTARPLTSEFIRDTLKYTAFDDQLSDFSYSFPYVETYSFEDNKNNAHTSHQFITNLPDQTYGGRGNARLTLDDSVDDASVLIYYYNLSRECASWMVQVNTSCDRASNNQNFGDPCVGKVFTPGTCVFARCDDGYYVNNTYGTHCRRTPDYEFREVVQEISNQNVQVVNESTQGAFLIIGLLVLILSAVYLIVTIALGCSLRRLASSDSDKK